MHVKDLGKLFLELRTEKSGATNWPDMVLATIHQKPFCFSSIKRLRRTASKYVSIEEAAVERRHDLNLVLSHPSTLLYCTS